MAQQRTRASHWETVAVPTGVPRKTGVTGAGANLSLHGPRTREDYELQRVLANPDLYDGWYVDMVRQQAGLT